MPAPADNDKFFLDSSVFKRPFFTRQKSELFAPDAAMLKDKLRELLLKSHSQENLDFIEEIYELNSKKDLSLQELKQNLERIEDKYIKINSESEINLKQSTLNGIRHSIDKTLYDYQAAVGDVIDLINANVSAHSKELVELDKVVLLNRSANYLVEELKKVAQQQALKTNGIFPGMFMKDEKNLYNSFRTVCEQALITFKSFAVDPERSLTIKRKQFSTALIALVEKLSASFIELLSYEKAHPKAEVRSQQIENLIDIISLVDKRVNSPRTFSSRSHFPSPGTQHRALDKDDSNSRTASSDTPSKSQASQSSSPAVTPTLSSRFIVLPPIKVTQFRHSSRAHIIESKLEEKVKNPPSPRKSK